MAGGWLPRSIELHPTMLGFRKDADQLRSDFDFLAIGDALEFCVLAELDELPYGGAVLLKERINAVVFSCWKICAHWSDFLARLGSPLSLPRGESELGLRTKIMSFVVFGKIRSTSASHRNAVGGILPPRTRGNSPNVIVAPPFRVHR